MNPFSHHEESPEKPQHIKAVDQSCSEKKNVLTKFRKIHGKIPVPESSFH